MIAWDTEAIFHYFGGTQGVLTACTKLAGSADPPTRQAVAVWKSRNKIASEWLPTLVRVLFIQGITDIFTDLQPVRKRKSNTPFDERAALGL